MTSENHPGGLRLIDLLVLVGVVICLLAFGWPVLFESREKANRATCKSNLKQIGYALALYQAVHRGRSPAHNGAQFIVTLYGAGFVTEPELFICPSSGDSNNNGKLLTLQTASRGTSYAAIQNRPAYNIKRSYGGDIAWNAGNFCADWTIASDDDEGKTRFNHGNVVIVLSSAGFVEEIPLTDPRVSGGLGGGGWLDGLSN